MRMSKKLKETKLERIKIIQNRITTLLIKFTIMLRKLISRKEAERMYSDRKICFPIAKKWGINREKYRGRGRPRNIDYFTKENVKGFYVSSGSIISS